MVGESTTPRQVKGPIRWLMLGAWLVGCAGQAEPQAVAPSDGGQAIDLSADSSSTAGADAANGGLADGDVADAPADATAATPADAGADATVVAADATATTDAAPTDATPDAAPDADAGPAYPPAGFGGEFLVDLGGSTDDGVAVVPWSAPGQQVSLIFGPQGGYHIWVSVCGPAALGSKAGLKIEATLPGGAQVEPGVTELTSKMAVVAGKNGQVCRVAAPAFVTCACELSGVPVRIRVEVTDLSGGPGSAAAKQGWAEKTVVPLHSSGPCWAKGSPPCAGRRAGG